MGRWSLNVTDKDIESGQIRVTREAKRDLQLMECADLRVRCEGSCSTAHTILASAPTKNGQV
jgi:hypothetical protein